MRTERLLQSSAVCPWCDADNGTFSDISNGQTLRCTSCAKGFRLDIATTYDTFREYDRVDRPYETETTQAGEQFIIPGSR